MLDSIVRITLIPTNNILLFTIIALGMITSKRAIFVRLTSILLFTMVWNMYLKSLWQIPLPLHIGHPGWAFPSGHMHTGVAFWGWLAYEFRKHRWFTILAVLLVFTNGVGMIYFKFHGIEDLIASFVIGTCSLIVYGSLYHKLPLQKQYILYLTFSLLTILMGSQIPLQFDFLWLCLGGLVGLTVGDVLYYSKKQTISKINLTKVLITFIGSLVIYQGFLHVQYLYDWNESITLFVTFFCISFWLSYGVELVHCQT